MLLYCEKDYPEFNETLYSLEFDFVYDRSTNSKTTFSIKSIGPIDQKQEVKIGYKVQLLNMKSIIESALQKIEQEN